MPHYFFSLLQLTFSDFDIENHLTCSWDSVTVKNGGSPGSPIIGQYCGSSNPSPIQSGSNQLVVIFNSDHSVQNGGFYATWSTQTLGKRNILCAYCLFSLSYLKNLITNPTSIYFVPILWGLNSKCIISCSNPVRKTKYHYTFYSISHMRKFRIHGLIICQGHVNNNH